MNSIPLNMRGQCVASDEQLFANIASALKRNLPEITQAQPPQIGPVVVVASGPSVASQIDVIRAMKAAGTIILAVRGGHDWLIDNGIMPDYALTVDPLPDSWQCFKRKNKAVKYLIASQVAPEVLDYLSDMDVVLWHAYMKKDQKLPKGRMLIGGSTTSGLRAVMVLYVLGFRDFHLFGFDSCLSAEQLRIDGSGLKAGDTLVNIQIEPNGETFITNPNMALQAQTFQDFYELIPEANFTGYGRGLIQAIIKKRESNWSQVENTQILLDNGRVSFIHSGGPLLASYRYRCEQPAKWLGGSINDISASTLVFSKPMPEDLDLLRIAKAQRKYVIVDICDDYLDWTHYQEFLHWADVVTCPTTAMAQRIKEARWGRDARIIPESYEFPVERPHFSGMNLLWFGHAVNRGAINRVVHELSPYPRRIVSNFEGAIPWSHQTMLEEFARADIVVMPATESYKSCNRTVEAVRQGCFVIAEPHPSLTDIPGIYIGSIREGLEWVKQQPLSEISRRISEAQRYVTDTYSPVILTEMWRSAILRPTTSDAETSIGPEAGSMSMTELTLT